MSRQYYVEPHTSTENDPRTGYLDELMDWILAMEGENDKQPSCSGNCVSFLSNKADRCFVAAVKI